MERRSTITVLVGGLILRLALYRAFPSLPDILDGRVECSTPVSSFKRLQEGLFLYSHGASPYSGGVFHQSPLLLALFTTIQDLISPSIRVVNVFYSLLDVTIAYILARVAASTKVAHSPSTVAAIYLFNPFTLLATIARSTAIFSNATIALAVLAATNGRSLQSMLVLGLSATLSYYPVYLAPSVIALCAQSQPENGVRSLVLKLVIGFFVSTGLFLGLSGVISGTLDSFKATYGTILFLEELTPNIGIWWYFFIEMFAYFRPFFLGSFQLYAAGYSIPVALRFKHCPTFAIATVWGLTTLFKSYPEIGDIGFYMTLLTLYKPMFKILKYPLLSTLALMYASVLAPTFFYLWIYAGSGNVNFFYAITLVYALGMTLTISDTIWSAIRFDYDGGKNPNLSQI